MLTIYKASSPDISREQNSEVTLRSCRKALVWFVIALFWFGLIFFVWKIIWLYENSDDAISLWDGSAFKNSWCKKDWWFIHSFSFCVNLLERTICSIFNVATNIVRILCLGLIKSHYFLVYKTYKPSPSVRQNKAGTHRFLTHGSIACVFFLIAQKTHLGQSVP